jgi:hypothetical protein
MPIPDNIDEEKLAEVALAILSLGAFSDSYGIRAWKGMDWDVTDILYRKCWIGDPKSKAKSVNLTAEGEKLSREYLDKHFLKDQL